MTPKKAASGISLANPIDNYLQPLRHWQPHCRTKHHRTTTPSTALRQPRIDTGR